MVFEVESHCCHVSVFLSSQNAMRELVSVSSGFRVPKVTAFWLGLAIWARSAEPGLQDEIISSAARSGYGSIAGGHVLFFVIEVVLGKIEDAWQAPRLCACPVSVKRHL